jgi:hypothetical protein
MAATQQSQFTFKCSQCDEVHTGIPALMSPYPVEYGALSERERIRHARLGTDDCVIGDEAFFVLALLDIPVHGYDEPLRYGLWVSLSRQSYQTFRRLYRKRGRERQEPLFAWLTSPPPLFPAGPLKAHVQFSPYPSRPSLELEPTDHCLAIAQREGITLERLREIVDHAFQPPATH